MDDRVCRYCCVVACPGLSAAHEAEHDRIVCGDEHREHRERLDRVEGTVSELAAAVLRLAKAVERLSEVK